MSSVTENAARDLISRFGFTPTRITPAHRLRALVGSLRPVVPVAPLIRLGPDGDGGYLVPNDFVGITACFSPGVSTESGFELQCAELGMQVFLADRSVDAPSVSHERFHFTKKFVGAINNEEYMTLDKWVSGSGSDESSDLLLQIDIEGFEYETLLAVSDQLLSRFRIIVAEFHNLHWLGSGPYFSIVSRVFEKLLQGHACVHLHPNNLRGAVSVSGIAIPPLMEMTFLRRDRGLTSQYVQEAPHPLDADNSKRAPLRLPGCWR